LSNLTTPSATPPESDHEHAGPSLVDLTPSASHRHPILPDFATFVRLGSVQGGVVLKGYLFHKTLVLSKFVGYFGW
jgi:hypothetical protein